MQKQGLRSVAFVFIFALFFILVIFYKETYLALNQSIYITNQSEEENFEDYSKYLVYSSKCIIPNVDPFIKEIKRFYKPQKYYSCRKKELLTYISKDNGTAVLHVDEDITNIYSSEGIKCCYSYVTRAHSESDPDKHIHISNCTYFDKSVVLEKNTIMVKCKTQKSNKEIYSNTHAFVTTEEVQEKLQNASENVRPLSVLFIGIDSISRLNFIRLLPKTHDFLIENDWIELMGYNKMGDNTFPNLMAIFTGRNESNAYSICNPKKVGVLDKCNLIWYDYKKAGFVTAYAEDETSINTFNFNKKGFKNPPTDFYFRPYMMASEKLPIKIRGKMSYCTGLETSGERIFNLAKDFAITFKNYSNFGVFWMNTFSHNELNSPSGMDQKIVDFFQDITDEGVLNNTFVIFLSDHGLRFGDIRYTRTGWYEERLPFIYFWIPEWFRKKYPKEFENLKTNIHRLTTPFDLYMTLQDILVFSDRNYTKIKSESCPDCQSLFSELPRHRSCEDASVALHWCTCTNFVPINDGNDFVRAGVKFVLDEIQTIIKKSEPNAKKKCAKYELKKILSSSISQSHSDWYNNTTYILLVFKTKPEAVLEATLSVTTASDNSTKFTLEGGISRLDSYNVHSKCISDAYLKKFCYCK